jgi:predicted nuclease of restriction endonuclease-like (RecB) superfamily
MSKGRPVVPKDYAALLAEVKERVRAAQYEALRAVNKELVGLYWDIGRMIAERQKSETWGKSVVVTLAGDLQQEFPGVQGFSSQNLWRMRQFHQAYAESEKLSPLVREISWTKNIVIFMQCKDPLEREFYLRMTRKFGWSKNVLIHQIENQSYEKTLLGQTNFDKALTPALRAQAKASSQGRVHVRLPRTGRRAFRTRTRTRAHRPYRTLSPRHGRTLRFCRQSIPAGNRG